MLLPDADGGITLYVSIFIGVALSLLVICTTCLMLPRRRRYPGSYVVLVGPNTANEVRVSGSSASKTTTAYMV